jgi:hypothetical protein
MPGSSSGLDLRSLRNRRFHSDPSDPNPILPQMARMNADETKRLEFVSVPSV